MIYLQASGKKTEEEVDNEGGHVPRQPKKEGDRLPSEANGVDNDIPQDANECNQGE